MSYDERRCSMPITNSLKVFLNYDLLMDNINTVSQKNHFFPINNKKVSQKLILPQINKNCSHDN